MLVHIPFLFLSYSPILLAGPVLQNPRRELGYRNASFEEPDIPDGALTTAYGLSFTNFRVSNQGPAASLLRYEGEKAIFLAGADTGTIRAPPGKSFNLKSFVVGCNVDRGISTIYEPLVAALGALPILKDLNVGALLDKVQQEVGPNALLPEQCVVSVRAVRMGTSVKSFTCSFNPTGVVLAGLGLSATHLQSCPFDELVGVTTLTLGPVTSSALVALVPSVGKATAKFDSFLIKTNGF